MLSHFFRKLRPPEPREPLQTIRANGRVWFLREGASETLGGIPDLDAWQRLGSATLVKKNLQRSIWRVTLPGGAVYLKQCRTNTPRAWLREILRPPKAQLEFENALMLRSRGIGCTEPLAWGMSDGRWPGDSFIVTREQPGAVPLDLFLERPLTAERRRVLAVAFGEYLAKLRDGGVVHPDAHPGNFLIEWRELPRFFLLDVHAVQTSPVSAVGNLVLLNRWFQLRASRTDRLRFWQAYAGPGSKREPKEIVLWQQFDAESSAENTLFLLTRIRLPILHPTGENGRLTRDRDTPVVADESSLTTLLAFGHVGGKAE